MSDHLHILITGDEGKGRCFLLSKQKVKATLVCAAAFLLTFFLTSYITLHSSNKNSTLSKQVAALHSEISKLSNKLEKSTSNNETLALQVNNLKEQNNKQKELFRQEKATRLNTAVTELEERSNMIERIMCNIGVNVKDTPAIDNSNSGGPFVMPLESVGKELLYRSDNFLQTILHIPLGRPIPGRVTSRYGHRIDPVNGKRGFHEGVDLKGRSNDPILATADGTVTKAFWNGGYGRYIEIDHGNGYITKFGHMKKLLVKKGDKVTRGQKIGLVGNSGRSTGSHLHYEICYHKKPVNPSKFMHPRKLNQAAAIKELNTDQKTKIKHLIVVGKTE